MSNKKKVMEIFGTRPEAIKMAPLIKAIEKEESFESVVVVTAQHREMLDQVLELFEIIPKYDLNIMRNGQTLTDVTTHILQELGTIISEEKPDIILVHGDTTTTIATSLSAFYHQVKIGHVEAGLRTWDKYSPFPEEVNRQLTDILSDIYFAPTEQSKENLLAENHKAENIFVTGNTAIDAMKYTISKDRTEKYKLDFKDKRIVLVTMHRRENLGTSMMNVFQAINRLVEKHQDIQVIFPIHKNPKVRQRAEEFLVKVDRIKIIEPLDVIDFHNLMNQAHIIMTDSGGIQEEAPSLGIPVLVLRDATERPEGVTAGTLRLVGTEENNVFQAADELLINDREYKKMTNASNPYGDGRASNRIINVLKKIL